jgi:ACS family D-galactonate transporter-like MFS transporter
VQHIQQRMEETDMTHPIHSAHPDLPEQSALPAGAAATGVRRSKVRYRILALLAVGTMINYLDRTVSQRRN